MAISTVKVNVNGIDYNLSYNNTSGKYEATITAPNKTSWAEENNKFGVTVTATDTAGNTTVKDRKDITLGSSLQLRVLEKNRPTINLTAPSSGARVISATPKIQFTIRDSESGVNIDSLELKINGSTITNTSDGMVCTSVTGGYDCVYTTPTALPEGAHTVTIQVCDNDGNKSDILSSAFTVDTIPPALNINSPTNNYITNNASLTIKGTTNDTTSSPVVISVKLNGEDEGPVTVNSGAFSKSITIRDGKNTIEITATDSAGLISTVTRTVTLDTVAPKITEVTMVPNPVDSGKTFVITVTVSD